jgi:hypothetical protein
MALFDKEKGNNKNVRVNKDQPEARHPAEFQNR